MSVTHFSAYGFPPLEAEFLAELHHQGSITIVITHVFALSFLASGQHGRTQSSLIVLTDDEEQEPPGNTQLDFRSQALYHFQ
jgi:hypothetical protein